MGIWVSIVTLGVDGNQSLTRERLLSPNQRQTFSGESTIGIMDLFNASIFSCWGIFNSAAHEPWFFAENFYIGACEEIGVNVQ